MKKPHKHAALIKAWADGEEIEFYNEYTVAWHPITNPDWGVNTTYRVKPEIVYPKTNCSYGELDEIFVRNKGFTLESLMAVANAAIKRAIDDGQVILPCKDMK